jgi:hypothetical protein
MSSSRNGEKSNAYALLVVKARHKCIDDVKTDLV